MKKYKDVIELYGVKHSKICQTLVNSIPQRGSPCKKEGGLLPSVERGNHMPTRRWLRKLKYCMTIATNKISVVFLNFL